MAKAFILMMAMRFINNKGFSLLESLIAILIMASMLVLVLQNNQSINLDHYYFMNEYLNKQSKALVYKDQINVSKDYSNENVYFSNKGKVNMAKTIYFTNHKVIIHLGSGYLTYE